MHGREVVMPIDATLGMEPNVWGQLRIEYAKSAKEGAGRGRRAVAESLGTVQGELDKHHREADRNKVREQVLVYEHERNIERSEKLIHWWH